jgi:3-methyladenine DNA glycosylase Tag
VLRATPDPVALATIAQRVFAAGFRLSVVRAKWPGFEEAFQGFDVDHVAGLDGDGLEALANDTRIVRNRISIGATVENARFVQHIAREHGSFCAWLADWPSDDTLGLWEALQAGGSRLGGDTGAWVLRGLGRDTFRFTRDASHALVDAGVLTKPPTGKKARQQAQATINTWSRESGLSLGAVSVVLACSAGEVYS